MMMAWQQWWITSQRDGGYAGSLDQQLHTFSTKDFSGKIRNTSIFTSKKNNEPPDNERGVGRTSSNAPSKEKDIPSSSPASTTTTTTTNSDVHSRREEARRIVVKRGGDSASSSSTSQIPTDPADLRQRVGLIHRRFPLEHEITDSGGTVIWTPRESIVDADTGVIVVQQLPIIHAAAWLDPASYCRLRGGQTIAGTAAARQLLRGKKDLLEVLGHAIYSSSSSSSSTQRMTTTTTTTNASSSSSSHHPHRSIVVHGHGLPPQILQHHLDAAAALLRRWQARDIVFPGPVPATGSGEAVRDLRWVHVRDVATGESRVVPGPREEEDPESTWADDLQLYYTVMHRMATRLGLAVLLKRPALTTSPAESTRRPRVDYSLSSSGLPSHSMLLHTPPHHWNIKFSREWHFLPQALPPKTRSHPLHPVMEWTPFGGVAAPGQVCIRLQGQSSSDKDETLPISLCFESSFRTNPTPSSSSSSSSD